MMIVSWLYSFECLSAAKLHSLNSVVGIRALLLESEEQECPQCHTKSVSPDTLIPNRFLRTAVTNFRSETGYTKALPMVQSTPAPVETPAPVTPTPTPQPEKPVEPETKVEEEDFLDEKEEPELILEVRGGSSFFI